MNTSTTHFLDPNIVRPPKPPTTRNSIPDRAAELKPHDISFAELWLSRYGPALQSQIRLVAVDYLSGRGAGIGVASPIGRVVIGVRAGGAVLGALGHGDTLMSWAGRSSHLSVQMREDFSFWTPFCRRHPSPLAVRVFH